MIATAVSRGGGNSGQMEFHPVGLCRKNHCTHKENRKLQYKYDYTIIENKSQLSIENIIPGGAFSLQASTDLQLTCTGI